MLRAWRTASRVWTAKYCSRAAASSFGLAGEAAGAAPPPPRCPACSPLAWVVDGAPAADRLAGWASQAARVASRTRATRTGPVRERTMHSLLQHPVGPALGTRPVWHALCRCAGPDPQAPCAGHRGRVWSAGSSSIEGTRAMRKLIVQTFLTLDGVMQAPGGPGEDDDGGFAHGGWSVNYWDDQMGQVMGEATSRPFAMVLGRRTYDIMAAYWPNAPEEAGGEVFNDATKYVASRSRPTLEWSNSVLVEGDAADGLAALKQEDGPELQVHGSGNLIQTLLRNNLVDQYRLWVFPLVIGSGKRLFSEGTIPSGLKLVDSKVSTTGVVIGTYEPAGEIVTGSFALD